MAQGTWYVSKASGGQGLVICEKTGRKVAVTYDESDATLIVESLEALREACGTADILGTADAFEVAESLRAILARIDGN